jgi:hypothetical protein
MGVARCAPRLVLTAEHEVLFTPEVSISQARRLEGSNACRPRNGLRAFACVFVKQRYLENGEGDGACEGKK